MILVCSMYIHNLFFLALLVSPKLPLEFLFIHFVSSSVMSLLITQKRQFWPSRWQHRKFSHISSCLLMAMKSDNIDCVSFDFFSTNSSYFNSLFCFIASLNWPQGGYVLQQIPRKFLGHICCYFGFLLIIISWSEWIKKKMCTSSRAHLQTK